MVLKHLPSVHSHSRSWSMLESQRAKCDKIDEDVRYSSSHTYLCSLRILFSLSLCLVCVWLFSCTFLALLFKKWIDVRLKEELSCEVCCFFSRIEFTKCWKSFDGTTADDVSVWESEREDYIDMKHHQIIHSIGTIDSSFVLFLFCIISIHFEFRCFIFLSLSKRKQKETAHCWNLCLWLFTYLCWIYLLGLCIAFDGELRNRLCAMHPSCWKCDQIHKFIYAAMINLT